MKTNLVYISNNKSNSSNNKTNFSSINNNIFNNNNNFDIKNNVNLIINNRNIKTLLDTPSSNITNSTGSYTSSQKPFIYRTPVTENKKGETNNKGGLYKSGSPSNFFIAKYNTNNQNFYHGNSSNVFLKKFTYSNKTPLRSYNDCNVLCNKNFVNNNNGFNTFGQIEKFNTMKDFIHSQLNKENKENREPIKVKKNNNLII